MGEALRGLLFQSARELIMNALKHAGPDELRISVKSGGDDILICVHDDGKGFDPAEVRRHADSSGGFGLFSVRERVEGFGGKLDIQSAPGRGTKATITLPVPGDGAGTA
jgi:signal transduction histidine kinase